MVPGSTHPPPNWQSILIAGSPPGGSADAPDASAIDTVAKAMTLSPTSGTNRRQDMMGENRRSAVRDPVFPFVWCM